MGLTTIPPAVPMMVLGAAFVLVPASMWPSVPLIVEEQRVGTVIDLVDPPESWERLGHDFRVIVHVAIWQSKDVLAIPVSALFRRGDDWAVFAVKDGRARATVVRTGQRNSKLVEVLSGLSPGDRVVLHPSDRVVEGELVSADGNVIVIRTHSGTTAINKSAV